MPLELPQYVVECNALHILEGRTLERVDRISILIQEITRKKNTPTVTGRVGITLKAQFKWDSAYLAHGYYMI